MRVIIHEHANALMKERGVTQDEIIETANFGEQFPAKFGRIGYRRNFKFDVEWQGKFYHTKQVEIFTIRENDAVVVITVVAKYF